jgi:hypothetical protein
VEERGAPSVRGREPSGSAWDANSPMTPNDDKCAQGKVGGRHLSKRGWPLSRMCHLSKRGPTPL